VGLHGIAVAVLHHELDALWAAGSRSPPPAAPPAALAAALAEQHAATAVSAAAHAAREAAAAARAAEARREEIPRLQRKLDKALRQIDELRGKEVGGVVLDADQRAKVLRWRGEGVGGGVVFWSRLN
jgi:hypothetical protein